MYATVSQINISPFKSIPSQTSIEEGLAGVIKTLTLEVTHVFLFRVECSAARRFVAEESQAERVYNIDNLLAAVLKGFFCLLSRRVGSDICTDSCILAI